MEEEKEYSYHPKQVDDGFSEDDYVYETYDDMISHAFERGLWPFRLLHYSNAYKIHLKRKIFEYWLEHIAGGLSYVAFTYRITNKEKLFDAYHKLTNKKKNVNVTVKELVDEYTVLLF